jgi:hypothetical protein
MENRRDRRWGILGMENRRGRRTTGVAIPDTAEGGPKLSCISCSTCLKTILLIL